MTVSLQTIPARIAKLPRDDRGYPVPWFVAWVDGKPVFPLADRAKYRRAIRDNLCWVCGQPNDKVFAFVIGPMCGINRTSSEPPSHVTCARFSAEACPFLTKPKMGRIDCSEMGAEDPGGIMLARNPGCCLVWVTDRYTIFADPNGKPLIEIGDPRLIHWYAEGRKATRAEIEDSVNSGIPFLRDLAEQESPSSVEALNAAIARFQTMYPKD